jgi:pilus assembly protein Flp/PilA
MIKQTWQYLSAKHGWNEEGATAVEYGIMVALIAIVIIVTVQALGITLQGVFGDVDTAVGGTTGGGTT